MPGFGSKRSMSLSRMSDEVTQSPPHEDWGLNRVSEWKLAMCWIPKKCYLTGKQLWGKRSYYGERWIAGPGTPVVDHFWIDRDEFIVWKLKQ